MDIESIIDSVIYGTADKLLGGPDNKIGSEASMRRLWEMTICIILAKDGGFTMGVNFAAEGKYQPALGRSEAYATAMRELAKHYAKVGAA